MLEFKINLQMFTGEDGSDGDQSKEENQGGDDGTNDTNIEEEVKKRVEAEKQKWEEEQQANEKKAKDEAKRLAKMTEDERAKHEEEQRLEALAKREQEVAKRELRAEVANSLISRNLPAEFIDFIPLTTAEETNKAIDAFNKVFRSEVEKGVNERLAGSAHPPGGGGSGGVASKKSGELGSRLAKQKNAQEPIKHSYF